MKDFNIGLEGQKKYFCYLSISSRPEAFIGIVFIAIVIVLTLMALYQYIRIHNCQIKNIIIKALYFTVFLWGISTRLLMIV
jgi:hypothetical protein